MTTSYHSYPKVFSLGHAAVRELFDGPVIVQEKIDGSQISFYRCNGELKCRSKGAEIIPDAPEKMFAKAIETVKGLDLLDGWTYRGEYLQKPHHNALAYDRVPNGNIILFDINNGEESYVSHENVATEAARLGLEVVPTLFVGTITSPDQLLAHLETVSILGGQKIEGVVIKNYMKFGEDKKVLMGKYVSEAYKEVHDKAWKAANPSKSDVVQSVIAGLRTPARWAKAVQHLRDAGVLTESPTDIGALIKETQRDTEEECLDQIKDLLWRWAKPQILRGVAGGLPQWYKEELLKKQF